MIINLLGNVGSGKTIWLIRYIIKHNNFTYANMDLMHYKKFHRIKKSDVYMDKPKKFNKKGEVTSYSLDVNWNFWDTARKKHNFDIAIDEIQAIWGSTRANTNEGRCGMEFLCQVRKVLMGNKNNHIFALSQRVNGIPTAFRDLSHLWIVFQSKEFPSRLMKTKLCDGSYKMIPQTYIYCNYFEKTDDAVAFFENGFGKPKKTITFLANPYYRYYDTHQIISMDNEYL